MFTLVAVGCVLLIFLLVMVLTKHQNSVHDLPGILESGRLYVLTDNSSMGFEVKNGTIQGFQYEIVKAFADSLGVELVVSRENDFEKCKEKIVDGEYNILANFTPVTTTLKHELAFSDPLAESRLVLVQRVFKGVITPDSVGIRKTIELANDTVCVPAHSPDITRLNHLAYEIAAPIHVVELKGLNNEQLVKQVAEGKIKYCICPEDLVVPYSSGYSNLSVAVPVGFTQSRSWAVNKQSAQLLEKLNAFLDDFIGSEAYWKIYKKYY